MLHATLLVAALLAASPLVLTAPGVAVGIGAAKPLARNVILLLDDGAGYAQHAAGSLYDTGLAEGEAYNDFPFQFAVSTYSYGDVASGACPAVPVGYDPSLAWSDFDYVLQNPADSAAAATAMATGVKTYDAAIGVDCSGAERQNVVEVFEALGRSRGVVSSVPFSHATPAAFVAHNPARDDYLGIAHEMIESSATDVIMGGGHPWYNRFGRLTATAGYTWLAQADWDALVAGTAGGDADGDSTADPWTLVQTKAEFQALMDGATPGRVFGVAQVRRTLQEDRGGDSMAPPFTVPFIANVPSLADMATGALNVLDSDEDGFFLMVEGGATDWSAHDNEPGRMIEEEIAFDRTVDAVLHWVDLHSNWGETLVIVATDHETGYLTGPASGDTPAGPVWTPLVGNGQGAVPGLEFNATTHTNSLVPLYAKGDAGRLLRAMADGVDPVRGRYVDNTDIHGLIVRTVLPTAP